MTKPVPPKTPSVYVSLSGSDCSAAGITDGAENGTLWLEAPNAAELSRGNVNLLVKDSDSFAHVGVGRRVCMKEHDAAGNNVVRRVYVVGLVLDGKGGIREVGDMFSGLFAHTCDSRFPFETPIPCHTRVE